MWIEVKEAVDCQYQVSLEILQDTSLNLHNNKHLLYLQELDLLLQSPMVPMVQLVKVIDTKVHPLVSAMHPHCPHTNPGQLCITPFCKQPIFPETDPIFRESDTVKADPIFRETDTVKTDREQFWKPSRNAFNHLDVETSKTFQRQEIFDRQIVSMELIPNFFYQDMPCLLMKTRTREQILLMNR